MFEGRFGEILVIFVLALVILGPEKLPKVVAEFGRWVGRARTMARQFREQLEEEVRLDEVRKAQAAAPKPTPAPAADNPPPPPVHETSQPPVDVAEAMNPHTHPSSPIDVTGLPPALAQAALSSQAAAQVPEASAPAAPPAATEVMAAQPAPATPQPLSEAPHP
jgi:sec-independent protein translocase protein TatB